MLQVCVYMYVVDLILVVVVLILISGVTSPAQVPVSEGTAVVHSTGE